jgi:hypothetical protein
VQLRILRLTLQIAGSHVTGGCHLPRRPGVLMAANFCGAVDFSPFCTCLFLSGASSQLPLTNDALSLPFSTRPSRASTDARAREGAAKRGTLSKSEKSTPSSRCQVTVTQRYCVSMDGAASAESHTHPGRFSPPMYSKPATLLREKPPEFGSQAHCACSPNNISL